MPNYGFIKEETKDDHWVLGSGLATKRFGAVSLMPDGHGWLSHLPQKEIQRKNGLETQACTVFGTANCLETLAHFKGFTDFPANLAERYNGVLAEITSFGVPPHQTCETFRRFGAIPEERLPFDSTIDTWEKFYAPNPMDENLVRLGEELLSRYTIGHEWLFNGPAQNKQQLLKAGLARGTVAVSVYAWSLGDRYYEKKGDDNHWVQLVDYKEGQYWLVNDHYEPQLKKLAWDFDFWCAKLYFLDKNTTGKPTHFFEYLIFLLSKGKVAQVLKLLLTPSKDMPPQTPTSPVEKSNREKLYDVSKASIGRDMSPKDAAPDSLACVESLRGVIKEAFGYDVAPGILSTVALDKLIAKDPRFQAILEKEALPGDISIALSTNVTHGHCGVRGKETYMSNDSSTGLWTANYNIPNWNMVFKDKLGLIIHYYRVL